MASMRRSSCERILLAFIVASTVSLLAGCAPRVLNEKPAAWPDPWQGRGLYHTPRAYIYASSPELAGQADRLADEVARGFEEAAGRPAPKGLLIVCDVKDPPVCADMRGLFVASMRTAKMRELGRMPTEAEMEEGRQGVEEMKEQSGCDPDDAIASSAMGLDEAQVVALLGLQPDVAQAAGWAAVLPSDAMVRTKLRKMMSDSLTHHDIGIVVRVMVAPVLLALEPKLVDMMDQIRKAVVFQQMALQQADWSADQVARLSQAYAEGVMRPAMQAMQAEIDRQATDAKKRAGGPESRPAREHCSATQSAPATEPAPGSSPCEP